MGNKRTASLRATNISLETAEQSLTRKRPRLDYKIAQEATMLNDERESSATLSPIPTSNNNPKLQDDTESGTSIEESTLSETRSLSNNIIFDLSLIHI